MGHTLILVDSYDVYSMTILDKLTTYFECDYLDFECDIIEKLNKYKNFIIYIGNDSPKILLYLGILIGLNKNIYIITDKSLIDYEETLSYRAIIELKIPVYDDKLDLIKIRQQIKDKDYYENTSL